MTGMIIFRQASTLSDISDSNFYLISEENNENKKKENKQRSMVLEYFVNYGANSG
jgi:hypothetical protein